MAANLHTRQEICRGMAAVVLELAPSERFMRRWRRRMRRLERQGDVRSAVLRDLSRMARRVG